MSSAIPLGDKPAGYYREPRANLIDQLPRPLGRVLDVGCGEGGANGPLRAAGAAWISGIEVLPGPAAKAEEKYDEVIVGDAAVAVERLSGTFDTILCNDVLEHLVDPGSLLRALRARAADNGVLHVSVPNARHVSLLRDLVFKGTFGYADYGHRDATHLRWFTRKDIARLLDDAGWRIERVDSSAAHRLHELNVRLPARIVYGLPGEFLASSWYLLARAAA
jgi:2-polyprenyl-3-methyl-5-hydroxy-6-metoxy-1,4-benzoquinol methylase